MSIDRAINMFQRISLSEMESVKLMNRTDQKYWFPREQLADILAEIYQDYCILEIKGERNLPYSTIYYDTRRDDMYHDHHRGKLNRYKIRKRNYISTNCSFIEVKFKSNKGRTIKTRNISKYNIDFDAEDRTFISQNSPYLSNQLSQVLENRFHRIMLVSKSMDERCTIDSELQFFNIGGEIKLNDLAIIEVKRDGRTPSCIINTLNRMRIKPSGFSKYCIGRSLTDKTLKQNNFKDKHRVLKKILTTPINNLHI